MAIGVDPIAFDAVENHSLSLSFIKIFISKIVEEPQSEQKCHGAENIDQRSESQIDGEHRKMKTLSETTFINKFGLNDCAPRPKKFDKRIV